MENDKAIWRMIDSAAEQSGVKASARKKWRARGVPPRHWYSIIEATSGAISARDLQRLAPASSKTLAPAAQIVAGMNQGAAE